MKLHISEWDVSIIIYNNIVTNNIEQTKLILYKNNLYTNV